MNTKQVGDVTEAMVVAELVRAGYIVSLPFGDNDPYDLVLDCGDALQRVQVKTGWLENGCVRFKTYSQTTKDGEVSDRDYTADEVDAFVIRCRDTDELYWVPIADAGTKNTYLRVEQGEIDHPSISYAAEYLLEDHLERFR